MANSPVENKKEDVYTIDIVHIFKCLWKRVWIIAIVSLLIAAISFSYAFFFVSPKYSSSVKLYVNNNSVSLGANKISISSADISASQSLTKTCIVILESRSTLEMIMEKANVRYTTKQLSAMITADSVNNTEVMKVTVTCEDPEEACNIANAIADVLPDRIFEIIEGSSMKVVDSAIINSGKVSPSFAQYTILGFIIGFVLSVGTIIVIDSLDDTIHDDDYIVNRYNCPLLGKVQNLNASGSKSYKYNYNYYYGRSTSSSDADGKSN
ncbi:MAG: hypothetical protein IKI68_04065 [Clostridia bacterium]|nr:hypothetical protein [Clostridia bacterium]